MEQRLSLTARLQAAAAAWSAANGSTPARLGRVVINDSSFFAGLAARAKGPSTSTLEQFAAYLADPAHWPDRTVAEDARTFAHAVGVSPATALPSAGKTEDLSLQERAA